MIPERCPLLDAMLEADLERRLAKRAEKRPTRSNASHKGWRTRFHVAFERDPLATKIRAVNSTISSSCGVIGSPVLTSGDFA
jgi:hypothetical protein